MIKINQSDRQNFKKVFDIFDKDGNGSINKQEIQTVFSQLKIKLSKDQLDRILSNFDANGDDSIQFEEFIQVIAAHLSEPESQDWVFQVFETIDQDCDGLISKQQLIKIVKLYNLQIQQKDIDLIIMSDSISNLIAQNMRFQQNIKNTKSKLGILF